MNTVLGWPRIRRNSIALKSGDSTFNARKKGKNIIGMKTAISERERKERQQCVFLVYRVLAVAVFLAKLLRFVGFCGNF